jgi:hypothetical protein
MPSVRYYTPADMLSTGPLVRIAPNEVSVSDPAAMKAIYAVNAGYTKVKFVCGGS